MTKRKAKSLAKISVKDFVMDNHGRETFVLDEIEILCVNKCMGCYELIARHLAFKNSLFEVVICDEFLLTEEYAAVKRDIFPPDID